MRRALLAVVTLTACRSVTNEPARATAVPETATKPSASASAPPTTAAVAPAPSTPPATDGPLALGTRPGNGPLYPIVDGVCIHGEIWPLGTTTLVCGTPKEERVIHVDVKTGNTS